jgi:hypothetical protein
MAREQTTGVVAPGVKGTLRNLTKVTLPRKWWQWLIATVVAVVAAVALLFVLGMHTGRLGFVPVEGNSMSSVFPWVFVIPASPKDGDYVVAWGQLDDPETSEDQEPTLLVKKLADGRLISVDSADHANQFEVRGVVIGQLPIQKVFWWMDKGGQNVASDYHPSTTEEHSEAVGRAKKTEMENATEAGGVKYVLRPGFGLVAIKDGKESQVELDAEITTDLCPYRDGVLVGVSLPIENKYSVDWISRGYLVKTKKMPAIVQSISTMGDKVTVKYKGGTTELSF